MEGHEPRDLSRSPVAVTPLVIYISTRRPSSTYKKLTLLDRDQMRSPTTRLTAPNLSYPSTPTIYNHDFSILYHGIDRQIYACPCHQRRDPRLGYQRAVDPL